MNKNEELSEILYTLKLHTRVDFEADDKSYTAERKLGHVIIIGQDEYFKVIQGGMTEARSAIRKLGKKLLCL